ncbi:hypothetical protein KTQ74_03365 [Pseudomonas chlororaphis]|uniref:hypothetical protein n=1 Tax=Pseudomonas chlororaphis TaxID=587753 RepID=UPI001E61876F|nr:hypothetical protein [Pseudomonas chlororaphis]MCB2250918.1 hypothetical protein [Pseudomonas chlororaphis]
MSYFVHISFDIKNAKASPHGTYAYKLIGKALEKIDYAKVVKGKRKKTATKLTANTFIAEFEKTNAHQTDITKFVTKELRKIFKTYQVEGKYFISTGTQWAWKIGKFSKKK